VPPDHLLTVSRSIDIGDRLVHLRHHGRGHTDSDITVTVADCNVTFAGDLLEQGAPPSFGDSFPLDWSETLDGLLEIATGTIVPGHGDVVDRAFATAQREQIAEMASMAREAHAVGASAEEVDVAQAPFPEPYARLALQRAITQLG
ncbi:MAG: MBL fold metallo-hydrolase, partial [Acidimicrobiia bacterium]|nr:MBL fold metallo-hydrolase [Acidimicrobiia bacterium]